MRANVIVHGLRELRSAMRAAGFKLPPTVYAALRAGAEPARSRASSNAPVLTGRLSRDIRATANAKGAAIGVAPGAESGPYAPVIEYASWGTPYLIPAIEETAPEVIEMTDSAIAAMLDETIGPL